MRELHVDPDGWEAAVADVDGPQLVVAGPGTGKTEFLARRARHLITERGIPPEEILLLSFSRRGAAELRSRVTPERSFTVIPALTFHALAARIVERHGGAGDWPQPPAILTGPEHVALVAELLAAEDPGDWPLPFRPGLTSRSFAEEVTDFMQRAAERLLGPQEIAASDRADWRGLPGFLARYRATLVERNRIDYGSLQGEAVRLLDEPDVRSTIASAFRYVLVDEYQDTTVAQARIVERVSEPHRNVTAAGDPYQSIYSFRGAELSNVATFPERFRDAAGEPARRLVLTTSFRVPRAILDAAVRVTAGIGLPGAAGPVVPAPGEGSVETYCFGQASNEAEWIASELQRVHLRDGIPYRRMAVVVRSKRRFLPELSRALDRRHIPHDPPDARLVDHPAVRPVLDLVTAVTSGEPERSAALRRVLLGPMVGLTLSAARDLERSAAGVGWRQALGQSGPAEALLPFVDDRGWAQDVPAADGFWSLWTSLPHFSRVVTQRSSEARAALASFAQALDRLRERDPDATLADYAEVVAAEDFEAQPLLEYRDHDVDRVALTTLHQAKGLEFDVVVIADAREGVLPDLRTRDSLLGARHLSPSADADDASYARFRLQEEMRLVYTAICRARLRVVFTCTVAPAEGSVGTPSRVLPLATGKPMEEAARPPTPWTDPTTPLEAEAWLRRRLRDPALPAADRLAALATLVDDAPWHPRPVAEFAGILRRGRDDGLVDRAMSLSPSAADAYDSCPRQYVFTRLLRVDEGGSVYQELGSLLHRVWERAEAQAMEAGADHADLETALEILDDEFDGTAFRGDAWAAAWKARAVEITEHLYDNWPGVGRAEALERRVTADIDGIAWSGRIDRVERRPEGRWIVDYKTGRSAPSVAEAARSLQLGFYVLAAGSPEDPVAGAELWFPATRTKSVTTREFDLDNLDDVRTAMVAAQQGVFSEDWTPRPGPACDRCAVRSVCPEWPEGREAFSS
ncbi:MAG TPA: ATP-dependent DNA helicase [Acidimicrobiia bacterium]|nr:ATP-dependent DNA helicase [Acidimicrobiia bacterium]